MEEIDQLRLRAARSRETGYATPIVDSVEEALALAGGLSAQIAQLPMDQRLLSLSHLKDVQTALDGRVKKLSSEMAQVRLRIVAANDGAKACAGYATVRASAAKPGPAE